MRGSEDRNALDASIAATVGLVYFGLYLLTLCRTVFWYDSAEYVTAAVTLGIPHPPGYPLYTLIGHLFTLLPIDPAIAVNAMSATFAAIAVALTYLVCRRLGVGRVPAGLGAATLGGGKLFWANAVVAEVYCPALAVVALVLYLMFRSREEENFRLTALASFLAGLGLGIHLSIATLGLGLALLVWGFGTPVGQLRDFRPLFARRELGARVRRSLVAGVMALLGSLVFLYLPLRAAQNPPLNFGNPSNLARFRWVITGGTYKGWFSQDLDRFRRAGAIAAAFNEQLLFVGSALAVIGIVWLWRRRALECASLLLMTVGNVGFFFRYQVHDLAVFFLPTTLILCCLASAGAQGVIDAVARVVSKARATTMQNITKTALVLFPAALAMGNYRAVDMSNFKETDQFIAALVNGLPRGAVILNYTTPPEWKLDAVFGMYVQKVLQERTDVDVVIAVDPNVAPAAMRSGRPVYAYAPVAQLARNFELAPDGPLLRVLGPRQSDE
ncbi:MAG: DUF2723 domain-containing protein [Polyangiales bacterium]